MLVTLVALSVSQTPRNLRIKERHVNVASNPEMSAGSIDLVTRVKTSRKCTEKSTPASFKQTEKKAR